jgi:hypothetical protein
MKDTATATAPGGDDPAPRAAGRRRSRRDRHDQQVVTSIDVLDMNTIETEEKVAAGARVSGRARVSAPRSRVKHVEVLVRDQGVSASDLRGPRPLPANHHPASLTPTGCPKSLESSVRDFTNKVRTDLNERDLDAARILGPKTHSRDD